MSQNARLARESVPLLDLHQITASISGRFIMVMTVAAPHGREASMRLVANLMVDEVFGAEFQ